MPVAASEYILPVIKVYMASLDEERTQVALARVEKEGREPGLGEVICHTLDLKDPRSAKASAERFMEKETRLDILSLYFASNASYFFTHGMLLEYS